MYKLGQIEKNETVISAQLIAVNRRTFSHLRDGEALH